MSLINRFYDYLHLKRRRRLVESSAMWYQSCTTVTQICYNALNDRDICHSEIGEILDRMDRELFALRNFYSDARGSMSKIDRGLAQDIADTTSEIYQLRNETVRFLIRCQGPTPPSISQPKNEQILDEYYLRALNEIGLNARQIQSEVNIKLQLIWKEITYLLNQFESYHL